jgi:hypothetical protein
MTRTQIMDNADARVDLAEHFRAVPEEESMYANADLSVAARAVCLPACRLPFLPLAPLPLRSVRLRACFLYFCASCYRTPAVTAVGFAGTDC